MRTNMSHFEIFESLGFEIFYIKMEVLVAYWSPFKTRCVSIDDLPCWQAFIVSTKITRKTPHGDPLYMLFTPCTSNANYILNCHLQQYKAIPFFTQCAMWYFCLICESAANFRMHSSINFFLCGTFDPITLVHSVSLPIWYVFLFALRCNYWAQWHLFNLKIFTRWGIAIIA